MFESSRKIALHFYHWRFNSIVMITFSVLGAIYAAPPQDRKGWVFNNTYTATGVLKLPYAEIEEQFTAWYDADQGKSRIDYYNGEISTK